MKTDIVNENDDDNDSDDTNDTCNSIYTISTGNAGFVLVNQVIDYIHRGNQFSDMCF